MSRQHLSLKKLFLLIICLFLATGLTAKKTEFLSAENLPDEGPWVVLTHYQDKADVLALKPFYDLWKLDEKSQTVLMVVDNRIDFQELITRGFKVELHPELMQQHVFLKEQKIAGIKTIDNFPCYRTVIETFDAMDDMLADHPTLVTLVDIGDSWHKANDTGVNDTSDGHDMQVVKITNSAIIDPNKPILYAMGAIHAREYPTAELVTRFAEHLLSEYGNNPDVTWLVDYHEIHLLLQGNPDGREISETEPSPNQRKTQNEDFCFAGNQQGVDMNRNFLFKWNEGVCGFGGCSSGNACSQVFRGDSAVSEPETMAINEYIKTLFPDDRMDDINDPAPLTKPGVYLDIHNFGGLTLFPWGYGDSLPQAPNHDQMQTLARRMSFYTGYRPEQSNASLGGADGASDDNAYGALGVAAYTIELGSDAGFYSSCSYFDNTIWPDNLPALIYAAKASRMPYITASGPDVISLPQQPIQVSVGQMINLSGTATDLQFNNGAVGTGNEPTQNITGIKAYINTPSWVNGSVAVDMIAVDGNFDSETEVFSGAIDSTGLTQGRYFVWFEATDAGGVQGVPSAIFVDVKAPNDLIFVDGFED